MIRVYFLLLISSSTRCLLRLLGCGARLATNIPADVSGIGSLANDVLKCGPTLASCRWGALVGKLSIDASGELADSLLHKGALCDTCAEEDGVDNEKDPRTLLEEDGGAQNTEPQSNLEQSNKGHGTIIIFLDKLANSLGCGGSLLLAA